MDTSIPTLPQSPHPPEGSGSGTPATFLKLSSHSAWAQRRAQTHDPETKTRAEIKSWTPD